MRADSIQVRGLKALVLLLLVLYEGHTKEICRTGVKIDKNHRGANLDERTGRPLYWFDLHHASDGYHPEHTYTLRLYSSSVTSPFSDAVLSVETVSGCGTGDLIVNSTYLYQPRHCPQMIMTEYKKPMTTVSFKWKAPRCGCVTFRTTVMKNGETYFYEDDTVSDGNLVKTVCPRGVRIAEQLLVEDSLTTPLTTKQTTTTAKMDRAARLDLLCKVTSKLSNVELLKRPEFIERRDLQKSTLLELLNIELALEQRRADINSCCQKKDDSRVKCFNNVRRYRIDQYCGDGQPRIPFVVQKTDYMKSREADCCWRIGESRYQCFNRTYEPTSHTMDYSFDDSDPANDIADYPTEVARFEEIANRRFFKDPLMEVMDESQEEFDPLTTSSTTSTTTTSKPTITPTTVSVITTSNPKTGILTTVKPPVFPVRPVRSKINGQGDMGYRKATNNPKPVKKPATSVSSVEITVNTLKQRLWKSSVKLECCQEGRTFATKSDRVDVWNRCKVAAREYRSSVVRGKKICSNTFRKCCVEQFITAPSVPPVRSEAVEHEYKVSDSLGISSRVESPDVDETGIDNSQLSTEIDDDNGEDDDDDVDEGPDKTRKEDEIGEENLRINIDTDDGDNDEYDDEDENDENDDTRKRLDYPTDDPNSNTIHKKPRSNNGIFRSISKPGSSKLTDRRQRRKGRRSRRRRRKGEN